MKRYGRKEAIEAVKAGNLIVDYDWYTIHAGYKVTTWNLDVLGYITFDLFMQLVNEGVIVKFGAHWSFQRYADPSVLEDYKRECLANC